VQATHSSTSITHASLHQEKQPTAVKKAAPKAENGATRKVKKEEKVKREEKVNKEEKAKREEKHEGEKVKQNEKAAASKPAAKPVSKPAAKPARVKVEYEMPGQTRPKPDDEDPLNIFYMSLLKQRPNSELARRWYVVCRFCVLIESHGCGIVHGVLIVRQALSTLLRQTAGACHVVSPPSLFRPLLADCHVFFSNAIGTIWLLSVVYSEVLWLQT
jgi:hypothetical protein